MNFEIEQELSDVDMAYKSLAHTMRMAWEAADSLAGEKADLEQRRAEALAAGVEAKNEATREAILRLRFADQYDLLTVLEGDVRGTRLGQELAQLEVERIRLRVRLMELAAGRERQTA